MAASDDLANTELCRCGHLRGCHAPGWFQDGHGQCTAQFCDCGKYRWASNVGEESPALTNGTKEAAKQ
jgi:hypothetical protein